MTTMFEDVKVGDKVFSIISGWGEVHSVSDTQIIVKDEYGMTLNYEKESGTLSNFDGVRCLFFGVPEIIAPDKPVKMKIIHGREVPDISIKPEYEEKYYHPYPYHPYMFGYDRWLDNGTDKHLLDCNMCYPYTEQGKQAAIAHAKAMLGID